MDLFHLAVPLSDVLGSLPADCLQDDDGTDDLKRLLQPPESPPPAAAADIGCKLMIQGGQEHVAPADNPAIILHPEASLTESDDPVLLAGGLRSCL